MTLAYPETTYFDRPCKCRAHTQHRLWSFLFFHPSATLRDASAELHVSYAYARLLSTRLRRKKDFGRLCPICFAPVFYSAACHACGFTVDGQSQRVELDFDATSPVHRVLPDHGLGGHMSTSNYARLARMMYQSEKLSPALLRTHAASLAHLAEPRQDPLLKSIRSKLLQVLKELYPDDVVSDMASKLASDEIRSFRIDNPLLTNPKELADQTVLKVLDKLSLLYPTLRRQLQHRNDATPGMSKGVQNDREGKSVLSSGGINQ